MLRRNRKKKSREFFSLYFLISIFPFVTNGQSDSKINSNEINKDTIFICQCKVKNKLKEIEKGIVYKLIQPSKNTYLLDFKTPESSIDIIQIKDSKILLIGDSINEEILFDFNNDLIDERISISARSGLGLHRRLTKTVEREGTQYFYYTFDSWTAHSKYISELAISKSGKILYYKYFDGEMNTRCFKK